MRNPPNDVPSPGPKGLGGWLILPIVGFWITAAMSAHAIFFRHLPLFFDGTWPHVTNSNSSDFHPLWGTILIFNLVTAVGLLGWLVLLLVLIHMKSAAAPRQAALFMATQFAIAIVAYLLLSIVSDEGFNVTEVGSLVRSLVAAVIWIAYFTASRRVRATFVQ